MLEIAAGRIPGRFVPPIVTRMTDVPAPLPPGPWRRFTQFYADALSALLAVTVGLLVIPVSLQIFSRYTELIPSYIWTEEMARFMFIWTIMSAP